MALLFKIDRRLGELPEKLQPLEKCGPALLCPPFLNISHSAKIEPAPAASHPLLWGWLPQRNVGKPWDDERAHLEFLPALTIYTIMLWEENTWI